MNKFRGYKTFLKNQNRKNFIEQIKNSPRLTKMFSAFESISQGRTQIPIEYPKIQKDSICMHPDFAEHDILFKKNVGTFFKHAISSIPYRRENEIGPQRTC
ncbi:hypothetical protein CSB09_01620 [Candidatus Gracilibacteria bacterium]|nr:MAG: hypothetical protein CSB09_01620 [Candidatus Gracilibacteria bacterium]